MTNLILKPIHFIVNGLLGKTEVIAESDTDIKEHLLYLCKSNTEIYANHRCNIVKNGGCTLTFFGFRVAYLYAIVSANGEVIPVTAEGILCKPYMRYMLDKLMTYLIQLEDEKPKPRNLYIDYIDSPIRHLL